MPRLTLLPGDITTARVDALVNAWNRNFIPHWLLIPQGVAGALRRRAGSAPFREVRRAGLLPLGGIVETGPGRLTDVGCILHVAALHATWRSSGRAIELSAAAIFRHAADREFDSLAIPLLGSGTGGVDPAASFRILHDAWRAAPRRPARTELYVFDYPLYTDLLEAQGWRQGLDLLGAGDFWDAHEAFEDIWALLPDSPAREALQALIQIAAACHKLHQAATRDPAGMQRGMQALLHTATAHLNAGHLDVRQDGGPERALLPGFPLEPAHQTLAALTILLDDWRDDAPLDALIRRATDLTADLADALATAPLLRASP